MKTHELNEFLGCQSVNNRHLDAITLFGVQDEPSPSRYALQLLGHSQTDRNSAVQRLGRGEYSFSVKASPDGVPPSKVPAAAILLSALLAHRSGYAVNFGQFESDGSPRFVTIQAYDKAEKMRHLVAAQEMGPVIVLWNSPSLEKPCMGFLQEMAFLQQDSDPIFICVNFSRPKVGLDMTRIEQITGYCVI